MSKPRVKEVVITGVSVMLVVVLFASYVRVKAQNRAPAFTGPQCFQPFSGVYLMFNRQVAKTGTAALNGRTWGALSGCAGLSSWPLVGSSHVSKTDGLVLAFRTFTVDATNCGAVDFIGTLKGTPLSGPFQLWNQRTGTGNTGTWTEIACPTPPVGSTEPVTGTDPLGNFSSAK